MVVVIVSNKKWNKSYSVQLQEITGCEVIYLNQQELVTYEHLKQLSPRYIFFPHWSYIIPEKIYKNFECVIFHMTDLPFGRGGSPLQNLISRGIYETKLTALRCVKELDAGPIYLQRDLCLYGNAEKLYLRAAELSYHMMLSILQGNIQPQEQRGKIIAFKRRRPEESNIGGIVSLRQIFDYIRMLDAEGYPKAFIDTGKMHLEFERAALYDGYIKADVKITIKEDTNE